MCNSHCSLLSVHVNTGFLVKRMIIIKKISLLKFIIVCKSYTLLLIIFKTIYFNLLDYTFPKSTIPICFILRTETFSFFPYQSQSITFQTLKHLFISLMAWHQHPHVVRHIDSPEPKSYLHFFQSKNKSSKMLSMYTVWRRLQWKLKMITKSYILDYEYKVQKRDNAFFALGFWNERRLKRLR